MFGIGQDYYELVLGAIDREIRTSLSVRMEILPFGVECIPM